MFFELREHHSVVHTGEGLVTRHHTEWGGHLIYTHTDHQDAQDMALEQAIRTIAWWEERYHQTPEIEIVVHPEGIGGGIMLTAPINLNVRVPYPGYSCAREVTTYEWLPAR